MTGIGEAWKEVCVAHRNYTSLKKNLSKVATALYAPPTRQASMRMLMETRSHHAVYSTELSLVVIAFSSRWIEVTLAGISVTPINDIRDTPHIHDATYNGAVS